MKQSKYIDLLYGSEIDDYTSKLISYLCHSHYDINQKTELSLLDVGCGNGKHSLVLSNYFKVYAIDIDPAALTLFRKHNSEITFNEVNLNIDLFPHAENSIDFIFSKSVIEHIDNTDHFLAEIFRVLKPGGKALIMAPAWETQASNFYDDYTHIKPFTRKGLAMALQVNEFKDVQVSQFYQLPFVWKQPALKIIPRLISFLPLTHSWEKKKNTFNKMIKFSNETMLLSTAVK